METRKYYYEDSHRTEMTATVLSCEEGKKGFEVVLSGTVFFPEGGGQSADTGVFYISEEETVSVLDVHERNGIIYHTTDQPVEPGTELRGEIDWNERFSKMQNHSGEHLVSGIIHRLFQYNNVGFHLGSTDVTIDFDGPLTREQLNQVEQMANEAVFLNLPVLEEFPDREHLATMEYRSKTEISGQVRIVTIPGYDCCACCGVHTAATGEVGLIKLFSAVGFRGGTRMELACGRRALDMLNLAFGQNTQVSQAFSAKWTETGTAAAKMNEALAAEKYRAIGLQRRLIAGIAQRYDNCGNVVHFEPGLDAGLLRELADAIAQRCGGIAAVFSGDDRTGYGFCILARTGDLRPLGKAMTQSLSGRGGGRADAQQGRVNASRAQIETFFANWN